MNPTFGSGIRNLIFENINRGTTDQIELILDEALKVYFPNLEILNMSIERVEDNNLISFSLDYLIKGMLTEDEITINFV